MSYDFFDEVKKYVDKVRSVDAAIWFSKNISVWSFFSKSSWTDLLWHKRKISHGQKIVMRKIT